ncbi:Fab1 phosphatidylinositol 3-phosphate 5-kinase, putative [Babesia ovis]|uniref:Fab1 phosphatidylinositol 3-phosphate 5-kinase, putative n=1 Tax=Babesia ovis TaxID=5869 RepID=A0A9W5TAK3_BABOV|nr:Fab1 phosphatidylinositol 3-phosphate 5-kinase, putative [Babesia ovis]
MRWLIDVILHGTFEEGRHQVSPGSALQALWIYPSLMQYFQQFINITRFNFYTSAFLYEAGHCSCFELGYLGAQILGQCSHNFFQQSNHIAGIRQLLVNLYHGEFGRMLSAGAFIAEALPDFKYLLGKPPCNESLEVELWSYTKIELFVQCFGTCLEGRCIGATVHVLQCGRLDLNKTLVMQELAQFPDDT